MAEGPFGTPKQMDTNPPGSKMAAKAFMNYALRGTWKTLCTPLIKVSTSQEEEMVQRA